MANRGNVQYTEAVDILANKDSEADVIKNMCNIVKINLQESIGYNKIKDNPKVYPNKQYRTENTGNEVTIDNIIDKTAGKGEITASYINNILTLQNQMLSSIGLDTINVSIKKGDDITAETINIAARSLRAVSAFFDGKNSWWDSNNYCKLSCQVACQEACQLACQSCQYNTCHAQNCGGWS